MVMFFWGCAVVAWSTAACVVPLVKSDIQLGIIAVLTSSGALLAGIAVILTELRRITPRP